MASFDPLTLRRAYTEHLGQLTCTVKSPAAPGMRGTDLGVSFARDDRVVFLFGDTLASDPALQDVDLAASAPRVAAAESVPPLTWLGPLRPRGLPLGPFGVPTDAFVLGDDTYVFFATRFDRATNRYATSALTRTRGLAFERLEVVHETHPGDFANVSVVVDGDHAFLLGSGSHYRRSAVRRARVPLSRIGDRAAWSLEETPAIDVRCVGELSVRRHPTLPLVLLAYNGDGPRGIALHLAGSPGGRWHPAGMLYEPADGYERFVHARESAVGYDDGLAGPGQEETWGGEYGPYFVPEWFTRDGDAFGIVYTLSSWNPYQVHLMRTWLVPPGVERARPRRGVGLPRPRIASDGTFTVDASTRALSFVVRRGRGRVSLVRGAEVVRCTRAPRWRPFELPPRPRLARWNLEAYRGETLRLVVDRADVRDVTFV